MTTYLGSISVRVTRRANVYFGLALGRYWATGAEHGRWHTSLRLPFLEVGVVRALPVPRGRVRITFMGWRGVDERPKPSARAWEIARGPEVSS